MIDLARHLWPALAIAFGLGIVLGWLSRPGWRAGSPSRVALVVAVLVTGALGLSAGLDLVPGRPGLWLDSALVHLVAYGGGCAVGWLARRLTVHRNAMQGSARPPA